MRKPGDIDKWRRLEGLTLKALDTLDHAMSAGTIAERTTAAKLVLDRGLPAIRASQSEVARALGGSAVDGGGGAGAGGSHLQALLAKAQARLNPPDRAQTDAATFAPLAGVEDNEPDMQLDTVNTPDDCI